MKRRILLLSVLGLLGGVESAAAGGFAFREQSALGMGQAFAGAAAGSSGVASAFWNPATMTQNSGWQLSSSITGIFPDFKITPDAAQSSPYLTGAGGTASTGEMLSNGILPATFTSYQLNDRLWLGLAFDVPYATGSKDPENWSGQIYGRTTTIVSAAITPSVAWKMNDWISLGAGIQALYFKPRITEAMSPLPFAPSASLAGHSWGYGFSLGATVTPMPGTIFGIGYRSGITEKVKGSLGLGGNQIDLDTGAVLLPAGDYGVTARLKLPGVVSVGISQRLDSGITLLGGFEWTNWSVFGSFPVIGDAAPVAGAPVGALSFQYKNSWYTSFGAEYALDPASTVRIGIGYEQSPITDAIREVRLPQTDEILPTIGFSHAFSSRLSVDMGYMHLVATSGPIAIVKGNPSYLNPGLLLPDTDFVGTVHDQANLVSLGLTMKL